MDDILVHLLLSHWLVFSHILYLHTDILSKASLSKCAMCILSMDIKQCFSLLTLQNWFCVPLTSDGSVAQSASDLHAHFKQKRNKKQKMSTYKRINPEC